jgi:TonB family protein
MQWERILRRYLRLIALLLNFTLGTAPLTSAQRYGQSRETVPESLGPHAADSVLYPLVIPIAEYPSAGRDAMIKTVVWTRVTVGEKGRVEQKETVYCDHPGMGFEEKALDALTGAQFYPVWNGLYPGSYQGYYPIVFIDPQRQYNLPPKQFPDRAAVGIDAPVVEPIVESDPEFPTKARRKLVEGAVNLRLLINEKGRVVNAKVVGEYPPDFDFDNAAHQAVKQWEFPVKETSGRKERYRAYCMVNFRISDDMLQDAGLPLPGEKQSVDQQPQVTYEGVKKLTSEVLNKGMRGTTWLSVLVDDVGRVVTTRVDTTSGFRLLDSLAIIYASERQYRPALKGGKPTAVWIHSPIDFLGGSEARARQRTNLSSESPNRTADSMANFVYKYDYVEHPDQQPKMTHFERSVYPMACRTRSIEGETKVAALIDEHGKPIEVRVAKSSGSDILDSAATAVVEKHEFEPGIDDGKPVKAWTAWTVEFSEDSRAVVTEDGVPVNQSNDLELPEAILVKQPELPRGVYDPGFEGTVWLTLEVNTLGNVTSASVYRSSGIQSLDEAALAVAPEHKFKPARLNGSPVSFTMRFKVEFTYDSTKSSKP